MSKNWVWRSMAGTAVVLMAATSAQSARAENFNVLPPKSEQDPRSTLVVEKALGDGQDFARFGFSLGMGSLGATGNRGALWSSGLLYDLAGYYWLTPQLALSLEGYSAGSSYYASAGNWSRVDVGVKHAEFGARYYGDLHTLLPRIAQGFVCPFASIGAGVFSMSKFSYSQSEISPTDTELGMTLGVGLKFEVVAKSLAVELLGRWNAVKFNDTYDNQFSAAQGVPDQTGQFVSWNANVLVTF